MVAAASNRPFTPAPRPLRLSLETLLTHPSLFALTAATPVQRALCRIADGAPLGALAENLEVRAAIGCDASDLPTVPPAELYLLAGIRGGKSLFAAALAVRCAITCDPSGLRTGEIPRVSILSLRVDLADVVFKEHLLGTFESKPALAALIVGVPNLMYRSLFLRHPSGRRVELRVIAGARAGGSLVSRWSAGAIFDEAPRMVGDADGVVNFEDSRKAVLKRMLPGAQLVAVGSPFARRGPMYEAANTYFGKPSRHLVVIRATGPMLNPYWWTPERVAETRAAPGGETLYRTEVLGEFADPESAYFSEAEVVGATRAGPAMLPREPSTPYFAFMDPATRRNAWTLVIAGRWQEGDHAIIKIARVRQWVPSGEKRLDPKEVLEQIQTELAAYGLSEVGTDQWSSDAIGALAGTMGFTVTEHAANGPELVRRYDSVKALLLMGRLELAPDAELKADLLSVKKRVGARGSLAIELPTTADGRHADYAPAAVGAVYLAVSAPSWVFAMSQLEAGDNPFR